MEQVFHNKKTEDKNANELIISLALIGFVFFLPVWINIYVAPLYLIIHGLMVFRVTKIKSFHSTIKPLKFGLILCGIPLGLLLIQNIFTIPLYLSTDSNVWEILIVISLTFVVSLVDFVVIYIIYKYWWDRKLG